MVVAQPAYFPHRGGYACDDIDSSQALVKSSFASPRVSVSPSLSGTSSNGRALNCPFTAVPLEELRSGTKRLHPSLRIWSCCLESLPSSTTTWHTSAVRPSTRRLPLPANIAAVISSRRVRPPGVRPTNCHLVPAGSAGGETVLIESGCECRIGFRDRSETPIMITPNAPKPLARNKSDED